jgi:hypothetical protein
MSFNWRNTKTGMFFSLILTGLCLKPTPSILRALPFLTASMMSLAIFVLWFGLIMIFLDTIEREEEQTT